VTRLTIYPLLSLALVHLVEIAHARGGCPPPRGELRQASVNGELELSVEPEPCDEAALASGRIPGAIYQLGRVRPERERIWQARSLELHTAVLVASDGDYVVTADPGHAGSALTVRNSAGVVIRSLAREDVVSIAEQLGGVMWRMIGLDPTEELVVLEVLRFDEASNRVEHIDSRRIQLMDGRVIDGPVTPPGFEVPRLACPPHWKPTTLVSRGELVQLCRERRDGDVIGRVYSFEHGRFRLIRAWAYEPPGDGAIWRPDAEGDACEIVNRGGEVISYGCGDDVAPPS